MRPSAVSALSVVVGIAEDLRESFYAHRVWFFALGFFLILVSIGKVAVLCGELPHPTDLAFHAFFGTSFLIGALTRRESCHKALVVRNGQLHSLYRYCLCATALVYAREYRPELGLCLGG